jgi:two-component system, LytTR family, response regulator
MIGDCFFVREGKYYIKVPIEEIRYLEASKNYTRVKTESRWLLAPMSLKRMEKLLPAADFLRIHRSFIVSIAYLVRFDADKVRLEGDVDLPVGDYYFPKIKKRVLILQSVENPDFVGAELEEELVEGG